MLLKEDATRASERRSTVGRGGDTFTEPRRARRVKSEMTGGELHEPSDYYFVTICVPAVIIALFVCYLFLKDRHKRLRLRQK
jgi:hypothetical protein